MEELHVSPEFVAWFCAAIGLSDVTFSGAWFSVSEADGETDLLLLVETNGTRFAAMIENKICAPEQPLQDVRYHLRGVRSREAGRFDDYKTCICAPEIYLNGLTGGTAYDCRVSYEAIRDWYGSQTGARCEWRRRIMEEAIAQSRCGYTMVVNPPKSLFHQQYWDYLQRNHPGLLMRRPTPKGEKSNWIRMKTVEMPAGVIIVHKNDHNDLGDQGAVDLTFRRTRVDTLLDVMSERHEDIIPLQKEGSAVLRIVVPKLDMESGVAAQILRVEEVLSAVYRLLPYSRRFA
jgi:hypothetical protein